MTCRFQRILDQVIDLVVRKLLIMRWWELGEIEPEQAEELIQQNKLEAA